MINLASTEWIGISPRVIVKGSISVVPLRMTPIFTSVPFGPRRACITRSLVMVLPVKLESLTITILSPANTPMPSDGPPEITDTTCTVSFWMENCTPMPEKEAESSELTISKSSLGIYAECGSRRFTNSIITSSVILSTFIGSTYAWFINWSSWSTFDSGCWNSIPFWM